MPCSSVIRYTDINEFRRALPPANSEIVITGSGCFSARIVTIDLSRLRLQRVDEMLARAWYIQMADSEIAIGFSASPGPPMRCQGFALGLDDLALFTPPQPTWHAISGPSQFAIMSLPKDQLADFGVTFAGQPLMLP